MTYGDFKDLNRRIVADTELRNKAFKKTSGGLVQNEITSNKELTKELHKPIIRKFKKRNVHSPFIGNIWGADLGALQLISKFNKSFWFLLCVIDVYRKYVWVIPLKDKKVITITNAFQKFLNDSNLKPDKIWFD